MSFHYAHICTLMASTVSLGGVCVCVWGGGGGKITKGGRAEKARSLRIWPVRARSLGICSRGGGGGGGRG